MSEFSVHSTSDTIPALRYCLVLDGERIAGGKPDYRGNNHLITWNTREAYGPIDQLNAENAALRTQLADVTESMGRVEERCAELRGLCGEMFKEHQRIYHTGGVLKMGPSATNKQMAHWYSECMRWGVEVD